MLVRALAALLLIAAPAALPGQEPAAAVAPLQARLEAVAAQTQGRMGIAALHLESGRSVAVNGGEPFPMASAYKVAVAAAFLHAAERGRFRLDQMFPLDERLRVRSAGIADLLPHPGVSLSAINLIELMITRSDNTATDVLVAALGGPQAVDAWLRQAGIEGQRVDRDTAALLLDSFALAPEPGRGAAETLADHFPPQSWLSSGPNHPINPAFDADPRDTSTPEAMATLLVRLHRGELLSPAHTRLLFDVMARTSTGASRVRALLPPGTMWAHKTGTLPGIAVDAGVVTLPDGSHVAMALFVRGEPDPERRNRLIAEAGRLIYDGFTLAR